MTEEDLRKNLHYHAGYELEDLYCMSGYQMLNAYLEYLGIIDYTDDIINAVKAIGIENL